MNDNTTRDNTEDYLSELDSALSEVDPVVRATILEDVRGHIADALDSGQAATAVLERLGSPESMALSTLTELGVSAPPAAEARDADTFRRTLLITATIVGAITAAVFGFGLQSGTGATESLDGVTQVDPIGLAVILLTLIPVIAAGLPLILPMRMRPAFTLIAAIAGTVLSVVTSPFIGSLYLPLVLLLWAAVLLPILRGRSDGRRIRIALRIAFTFAAIAPPALIGASLVIHSFDVSWIPWAGALLGLLLVVLFAAGMRAAYLSTAVLGGGMMIFALIDSSLLSNETWLAGGLYLTIGLSALLSSRAGRGIRR